MTKKIAIIVHGGTIDQILCAFILGSTAVALDWEAHLYFTFWGLTMLQKGEMDKAGLPATYKHLEEYLRTKLKAMNTLHPTRC